jgi:hypothetical protein
MAFVASVPNGSTIVFPAGGVFRMDKGLRFTKSNLTFVGNGATLRSNAPSSAGRDASLFYPYGSSGIVIRNFNLVGNSPTPGVYSGSYEHAAAITIVSGSNFEIDNVTVSGVGGDGLTLSGVSPNWPDGIWWHDSHVITAGRMGIGLVAGRNVTVERVTFDRIGYGIFDIEPNDGTQGADTVVFRNNTIGGYEKGRGYGFFFGAEGADAASVSNVTVTGNTITGDPLDTYVRAGRRQNITITNNTSVVMGVGPVLYLAHIDGLTVKGNSQPMTSGALASITDCTNVVTSLPNTSTASSGLLALPLLLVATVSALVVLRRRRT